MPSGVYKKTEDHKRRISESLKGYTPVCAFVSGENHPSWKGGRPSCKTCGKIVGYGKSFCILHCQGIGKESVFWKGENAGYNAKHYWKLRREPRQRLCSFCGKRGEYLTRKNGVKYWNIQWANKSGKYLRIPSDWVPLCFPCHRRYDTGNRKKTIDNFLSFVVK